MDDRFLSQLDQAELLRLRAQASQEMQNVLAPYEHRAYARESVSDNPWMAVPIGLSIPAYQGAKLMGLMGARSAPSLDQFIQGYRGIYEGLTR